ncbi:MAG TPA: GFA family protein [Povalibacter sp.]|nr:GFA family protein [Povalibacter sp.]
MTTAVAEGGCLCGAIRYRLTAQPRSTSLCHCRSCRLAAGAPSVAWVVLNAADFHVAAGVPTEFRSSAGVVRTFCNRCGTPLTYQHVTELDRIDITTASLDSPDMFPPTREIWLSHKISWERANDALAQYPGSSRDATPAG